MQSAVFRALEFDRIRDVLAREAATALGRERALTLEPATDPAEVARRLALTAEAVAFAKAGGSLAIDAPEDLPEVLIALDLVDEPLLPLQLLGLARFVESVDETAAAFGGPAVKRARHSPARRRPAQPDCDPCGVLCAETAAVRRADPARRRDCRRREPGAARHSRVAAPAAREAPLDARVADAQDATRRSTCRIRSSPTATAGTSSSSAPNTARRSRASCTAARRAARASISNR